MKFELFFQNGNFKKVWEGNEQLFQKVTGFFFFMRADRVMFLSVFLQFLKIIKARWL